MTKGIQQIFSEVPKTYEFVNHILTLGLDVFWRKRTARFAASLGGTHWLDVCSGTGDMIMNLSGHAGSDTRLFAADFSLPMLSYAMQKRTPVPVNFALADIKTLPFKDNSMDLITISFATRNINLSRDILIASFADFRRVLKPGGSFVNLETTQPGGGFMKLILHTYSRVIVKPLGTLLSGSSAGYTYLSKTIPRFYRAEELAEILLEAGFGKVEFHRYPGGLVARHHAVK